MLNKVNKILYILIFSSLIPIFGAATIGGETKRKAELDGLALNSTFNKSSEFDKFQSYIQETVGKNIATYIRSNPNLMKYVREGKKGVPTYAIGESHLTHLYGIENNNQACVIDTILKTLSSLDKGLAANMDFVFKLGVNAHLDILKKNIIIRLDLPKAWNIAPILEESLQEICKVSVHHITKLVGWIPHITLVSVAGPTDSDGIMGEEVLRTNLKKVLNDIERTHNNTNIGSLHLDQIRLTKSLKTSAGPAIYVPVAEFEYQKGKKEWIKKVSSSATTTKKAEPKKEERKERAAFGIWTPAHNEVIKNFNDAIENIFGSNNKGGLSSLEKAIIAAKKIEVSNRAAQNIETKKTLFDTVIQGRELLSAAGPIDGAVTKKIDELLNFLIQ